MKIVFLFLFVAVSLYAGMIMKVHTSKGNTSFAVGNVDSVTFEESKIKVLQVENATGFAIEFGFQGKNYPMKKYDSLVLSNVDAGIFPYSFFVSLDEDYELEMPKEKLDFSEGGIKNDLKIYTTLKQKIIITKEIINGKEVTVDDTVWVPTITSLVTKSLLP